MATEQSNTFFKLMEERYHRHSTIITTNLIYDDISFHIDCPLMQPVNFGNPRRKRLQMHSLHGEQLPRHRTDMFLVCRIHPITPLARLLIQITPAGECTAGEEVAVNESERTFYTRRAVGIASLMRHEAESEPVCKCLHFRHRDHLAPGAAQHKDVCVVDHHVFGDAHIPQRAGEKDLAVEPLNVG
jgi:hypothetical protein